MINCEELRNCENILKKMYSYYTYTLNKTVRCTPPEKSLIRKISSVDFANNLTLPVPILNEEKKIKLNFYFHTFLWHFKRFYEDLKGLYKT